MLEFSSETHRETKHHLMVYQAQFIQGMRGGAKTQIQPRSSPLSCPEHHSKKQKKKQERSSVNDELAYGFKRALNSTTTYIPYLHVYNKVTIEKERKKERKKKKT